MLSTPHQNPLAAGWNKLYIPYCDGGSFAGQNMSTTWTQWSGTLANGTVLANATVPLYFRGRLNLAAVVDAAIARHGLGDAGRHRGRRLRRLATYWSADWWGSTVRARVWRPDSGCFLNSSRRQVARDSGLGRGLHELVPSLDTLSAGARTASATAPSRT